MTPLYLREIDFKCSNTDWKKMMWKDQTFILKIGIYNYIRCRAMKIIRHKIKTLNNDKEPF